MTEWSHMVTGSRVKDDVILIPDYHLSLCASLDFTDFCIGTIGSARAHRSMNTLSSIGRGKLTSDSTGIGGLIGGCGSLSGSTRGIGIGNRITWGSSKVALMATS
jgi:hypothetical protein